MRLPFDEAELLELVHDDRGVGAVDAVRLGQLGEGHRLPAQQEQDLDPPAARAQPQPLPQLAAGAVGLDELPHQLPRGGGQVGRVGHRRPGRDRGGRGRPISGRGLGRGHARHLPLAR
jgi:hypothetical protein